MNIFRGVVELGEFGVKKLAGHTPLAKAEAGVAKAEYALSHSSAAKVVREAEEVAAESHLIPHKAPMTVINEAPKVGKGAGLLAAAGAVSTLAVTGAGIYKANQVTNAVADGARHLGGALADGLDKLETRIEDLPFGDIGGGVFASAKTGVTIFVAIGAVVAAYQIYKLVD